MTGCWKVQRIAPRADWLEHEHARCGRFAAISAEEIEERVFSPGQRSLAGTSDAAHFVCRTASFRRTCSANDAGLAGGAVEILIIRAVDRQGDVGNWCRTVRGTGKGIDRAFCESISVRLKLKDDSTTDRRERACRRTASLRGSEDVSHDVESQRGIRISSVGADEGVQEGFAPRTAIER